MFVPLTVVPMNLPLSSITMGPVASIVGAAKTVVATQMVMSDPRIARTRECDRKVPIKGNV